MNAVFVDTGAWYAIQVPNDRWHPEAAATLRALAASRTALVTTTAVVGETYTLLMSTRGHGPAWRFVDALRSTALVEVSSVEPDVEARAWEILRRYEDQRFSYVDGTSFALMRSRGISRAFAFDRHFSAAGFVRVPVDEPA